MAQERTLIGCATYVVGDYHFNQGTQLPVADEHVEYIDSLTDRHGDPLFSAEAPKAEGRKSVTISKGGKKQQEAKKPAEGGEGEDAGQTATV